MYNVYVCTKKAPNINLWIFCDHPIDSRTFRTMKYPM